MKLHFTSKLINLLKAGPIKKLIKFHLENQYWKVYSYKNSIPNELPLSLSDASLIQVFDVIGVVTAEAVNAVLSNLHQADTKHFLIPSYESSLT